MNSLQSLQPSFERLETSDLLKDPSTTSRGRCSLVTEELISSDSITSTTGIQPNLFLESGLIEVGMNEDDNFNQKLMFKSSSVTKIHFDHYIVAFLHFKEV